MTAMAVPRELRDRIVSDFRWVHDPVDGTNYADVTGWWRDPITIDEIASGLGKRRPGRPTGGQS